MDMKDKGYCVVKWILLEQARVWYAGFCVLCVKF